MNACPICANKATRLVYCGYPGYQKPDVFDIYECGVCRTSFAVGDMAAIGDIYEAIYRQIDQVPGYQRYAQYAREVAGAAEPLEFLASKEPIYYGVRKFLKEMVNKEKASILEVGSGLGYLTFALAAAGFRARGVDIAPSAVDAACERYGGHYFCSDIREYAAGHPQSQNVVIATEVIEHLSDLYPFMEACLRVLAPQGLLFITTPNREAHAAEVPWAVEGPPVHLSWFSKASLETLARKTECEVKFLDVSDHPAADVWFVRKEVSIKPAVLDHIGNVLAMPLVKRSLAKRIASKVRRVFMRQSAEKSNERLPSDGLRECPTLFAIFRKRA